MVRLKRRISGITIVAAGIAVLSATELTAQAVKESGQLPGKVRVSKLEACCAVEAPKRTGGPMSAASAAAVNNDGSYTARDLKTGKTLKIRLTSGGRAGATGSAATSSSKTLRAGQIVHRAPNGKFVVVTSFPVEASRKDEIGASSRKMWTDVTVSKNGRIDGKTRIKTAEAMRGFTGAVEVGLTDIDGNILFRMPPKDWGVDGTAQPGGKSERTESWTVEVPADAMNKVAAVVIAHHHSPKNRFPGAVAWVVDNWECAVEIYQMVKAEDESGEAEYEPVKEGENMEQAKDLLKACKNIFG